MVMYGELDLAMTHLPWNLQIQTILYKLINITSRQHLTFYIYFHKKTFPFFGVYKINYWSVWVSEDTAKGIVGRQNRVFFTRVYNGNMIFVYWKKKQTPSIIMFL